MLRFCVRSEVLLRGLLIALLLLVPACAGEEAPAPGSAIAGELLETEAGGALVAVLAEASETDRLVFLHTGADW